MDDLAKELARAAIADKRNKYEQKRRKAPKRKATRGKPSAPDLAEMEELLGTGVDVSDIPAASVGKRSTTGRKGTSLDLDVKGIFVSIHQFCQETGKDRASIDKKLRLGMVHPITGPKGQPLYRLREMIELAFYRDDNGLVDIDKMDPFRRKAHYDAENNKLKMLSTSAALVPIGEVEQEQGRILKLVAQFFDTLPDILERDCGMQAKEITTLEKRLDAVREDIYSAITKKDDDGQSISSGNGTGVSTAVRQGA